MRPTCNSQSTTRTRSPLGTASARKSPSTSSSFASRTGSRHSTAPCSRMPSRWSCWLARTRMATFSLQPTSFDQMARELNANASTAAAALGVSVDSDSQGLLSAVAIRLFRAYIETKRSATLREAIAEVQSQVDEFSDGCPAGGSHTRLAGPDRLHEKDSATVDSVAPQRDAHPGAQRHDPGYAGDARVALQQLRRTTGGASRSLSGSFLQTRHTRRSRCAHE